MTLCSLMISMTEAVADDTHIHQANSIFDDSGNIKDIDHRMESSGPTGGGYEIRCLDVPVNDRVVPLRTDIPQVPPLILPDQLRP